MAATDKAALIATTRDEFARLSKLIADLDPQEVLQPDDEGCSIKDIIAHRAHWIDLFLGWYRDGQAGQEVAFPAPGYKWNQLKAYNAVLRAQQAGLAWQDAVRTLNAAHARLMTQIEALDGTALYGGPMKGARNSWTTGRWAEAAGASHYRSAAKYIRARRREMTRKTG